MPAENTNLTMQIPRSQVVNHIIPSALESNASTISPRSPPISPRPSISEHMNMPLWLNERTPSMRSRPSRASSIRSTRTGISVNTLQDATGLDDARSIDLHLGEQAFRISRDGSRITDHQYLPPYSTSPLPYVREESAETIADQQMSPLPMDSQPSVALSTMTDSQESSSAGPSTPKSSTEQIVPHIRTNASGYQSSGSTIRRLKSSASLNRHPSFTPGQERISVDKRRTVSEGDVLAVNRAVKDGFQAELPLERRNAIRLPKLVTGPTHTGKGRGEASTKLSQEDSESPRIRETQSAGPVLKTPSHEQQGNSKADPTPLSPSFIGRHAPGIFPAPKIVISHREYSGRLESEPSTPTASGYVLSSPAFIEEGFAETHMPPAMDNENDISIHYTRMIRSIDRDYRKALHSRDVEMADLREKLHEKDTVYRQELRARDFHIEDLRARLEHLEGKREQMVEKARNEVEDLWESRWKDRGHHLLERMRRIEADGQKQVEQAIAERDREWAAEWTSKQQQLIERVRIAEGRAVDGSLQ